MDYRESSQKRKREGTGPTDRGVVMSITGLDDGRSLGARLVDQLIECWSYSKIGRLSSHIPVFLLADICIILPMGKQRRKQKLARRERRGHLSTRKSYKHGKEQVIDPSDHLRRHLATPFTDLYLIPHTTSTTPHTHAHHGLTSTPRLLFRTQIRSLPTSRRITFPSIRTGRSKCHGKGTKHDPHAGSETLPESYRMECHLEYLYRYGRI
jgi:hypothetical protein